MSQGLAMTCELKLENVLHCYIVEYQRLTVLHGLLHAVTRWLKYHKNLIIKYLLCYINDNDSANDNGPDSISGARTSALARKSFISRLQGYFLKFPNKNAQFGPEFGLVYSFTYIYTKNV